MIFPTIVLAMWPFADKKPVPAPETLPTPAKVAVFWRTQFKLMELLPGYNKALTDVQAAIRDLCPAPLVVATNPDRTFIVDANGDPQCTNPKPEPAAPVK